MYYNTN